MSIYRSAVNKPVTTFLIYLALAILGVFSLVQLPIDNFPDIESNVLMVMSSYPGASAEDVENNLTKLLENSLNGVSDLKDLSSQSRENISFLTLEFNYGTDLDVATNDVRDKLDMVKSTLPDGASNPTILKFSASDMPIYIMAATADQSVDALEKILDERLATPLARVKGVGTVSVAGAPKREIQVYVDPDKLAAYNLTISAISGVIAAENRNVPSGNIDIGSNTYTLRVEKEFDSPSELSDLIVGYSAGRAVYLRDVARISDNLEERSQESYTNGARGAQIIIQKQSGANTVNVVKAVKKAMVDIKKNLPSDVEFTEVIDSSENIVNTINSLKETILITFLVVMLVVYVFLGRWRATFIIVLSIPIALLASLMYLFGIGSSLNIISMSALSIAIGMVVDDAIVVLENVSTHLERGEKPKEAAVHATSEVGISVIASTLTMLCVFLPLTMMSGMAGILFRQLGFIVSIIMIVSTTAALTLVPMLCSKFLKAGPKTGKIHVAIFTPINKGLDKIASGYSRLISWSMAHKKIIFAGAVGIFVLVIGALGPGLKTEYFPNMDMGRLNVTVELPVGTAQGVTADVAQRIYDKIREDVPEIQVLSYRFGQADSDNAFASMQSNGTHIITMNINIGSKEDRTRSSAEIADIVRKDLKLFPELHRATVTEGMGGGMGGASTVEIEIYGYDFEETGLAAHSIQKGMNESGYFAQVNLSRDQYTPEYIVDFDRQKLAINGLTSTTAAAAFSAAMNGTVASFYREDGDEYNIRVRYAPEFRRSLQDIENVMVYNPMGKGIKIKDLGTIVESQVPPSIERKNRERMITVTGIVGRGHALSEAVVSAEKVIDNAGLPANLSTYIGGSFEDQQDMFKDMSLLIILIVLLVYMVMASQFESFMGPFVIMFSIPFAFIGVILGLWVTGTALGMMAMVGVIILLGIVVKNGIVLIDYTILCQERGMSVREASITAAKSRLRPILMTTLTTVLGMIPMAVGTGEGAEMWRSLGMTVVWGLSISTLVTLVIIPTMYCGLTEMKAKRNKKK
ncbi:hydrophobic/amphiphilic exporter-1, HAE1 family [Bacteroidales bacterium WCE2008]|nr:efflux RND transporter permease subunit [Bacteroidales bacterium]MBR6362456.1 efflux RND transporter permease subunit [Bacteroidales bacterium]MEE3463085.1 efflux RND transporter permease subunit [Candidatus Cryptobacteroides sp.]SKC37896.1 hydrophobic/amphiphilic exporter-1, HAE1 family [Bacteroidales bacterium WCE2008]